MRGCVCVWCVLARVCVFERVSVYNLSNNVLYNFFLFEALTVMITCQFIALTVTLLNPS